MPQLYLVCPACKHGLFHEQGEEFVCRGCGMTANKASYKRYEEDNKAEFRPEPAPLSRAHQ